MLSFQKIKGEGFKVPAITLASHSCVVYLKKLLLKKVNPEKKVSFSSEVSQKLEKLLSFHTQAAFKEYQAFFTIAENFLSPQTSIKDFENSLITSLFPHYDYLQKFLPKEPE